MQNITLEKAGQIPTNLNACFEDGEWWVRGNADGGRRRVSPHNHKNSKRMFVDGKYIPQAHPLWKSGRYTSFNDAAFSSLQNYPKSTVGCVYILHHHIEVPDRHVVELRVHQELELVADGRHNEWFKINTDGAIAVLNSQ